MNGVSFAKSSYRNIATKTETVYRIGRKFEVHVEASFSDLPNCLVNMY